MIERVVTESEEFDDSIGDNGFSVEPSVNKIPREKQLQGLFGRYSDQIPNDILRYMRKNPQLIMDRLVNIYGNKFLDYAEKAYNNKYFK
jgi:hypothetical protein